MLTTLLRPLAVQLFGMLETGPSMLPALPQVNGSMTPSGHLSRVETAEGLEPELPRARPVLLPPVPLPLFHKDSVDLPAVVASVGVLRRKDLLREVEGDGNCCFCLTRKRQKCITLVDGEVFTSQTQPQAEEVFQARRSKPVPFPHEF